MSLNRPATFAGRFCRTCSNIWSSNPCGRNCRKSGTHRGDKFGLPARRLYRVLRDFSIHYRAQVHTAFTRAGTRCDMTNFHETNLPESFQRFVLNLVSKLEKLLHGEWISGVSKKIEYPFSSDARSFATRCDSNQHYSSR